MAVEFINSEICEIDGERMIFFSEPFSLFNKIHDTVLEIGGEKFFSSTDLKIKKIRESLAGVFFLLAIKKFTNQDWYLMQPEAEFPDFFVISMNNGPKPIEMHGIELTEIPPRCETFEEAMEIVDRKLKKGYPPSYILLIYVNNVNSTSWIQGIHANLDPSHPFKEIWTLHVLSKNNNTELDQIAVNRISPNPVRGVAVSLDDPQVWVTKTPPSFARIRHVDGRTFLGFAPEFIKAFRKFVGSLRKKK